MLPVICPKESWFCAPRDAYGFENDETGSCPALFGPAADGGTVAAAANAAAALAEADKAGAKEPTVDDVAG